MDYTVRFLNSFCGRYRRKNVSSNLLDSVCVLLKAVYVFISAEYVFRIRYWIEM